jgi:glycosyltransferase involved in cell wall biosynthesis
MRVLVATRMYPTPERPVFGTFVRSQVEALRAAGLDLELLVADGDRSTLEAYRMAYARIRQVAHARSADLIHAHFCYPGVVARAQRALPVVVTFHGSDLLGDIGDDGKVTARGRAQRSLGRWLTRHIDAAIVQSEEMAAVVADGVPTHVIPHEVDLNIFKPMARARACAELGLDPDRSRILFAADPRIPVKGFPFAQAVVASLRDRRGIDVDLHVVYRDAQERLAVQMNACDVLIFPSFQEGSPNIIKQAMACGLPLVSTDVGDVRERLDGVSGCHVLPRVESIFADAIESLLGRRVRTDARSRLYALEPQAVARRVIAVYEQVLAQRRVGQPAHAAMHGHRAPERRRSGVADSADL